MRYTIRNVPNYLDAILRQRAREQGKSLNEVVIGSLLRGVDLGKERHGKRDLSDIAGTWRDDPVFERAVAEQDTISEEVRS